MNWLARFFSMNITLRGLLRALVVSVLIVGISAYDGTVLVAAAPQKRSSTGQKQAAQGKKQAAQGKKQATQSKKQTTKEKKQTTQNKKQTTQSKKQATQGRKQTTNNQNKKNSGAKQSVAPKSSDEARRMQEAAQREIQQTKEQLRLNEQEVKTGLSDLNRLSSEIAAGRTRVAGLQKKVSSLNLEISSIGGEIEKNEAELKLMREEYLKAIKKMRLTKRNQSELAFIFASENFNQAMRRIRYLRQFSAWKEKKSSDIDKKISRLDEERKKLAQTKEAQTVALGQLNKSQADLEVQHGKQETLVAKLRQNGDALRAHLAAKQSEANRLKESISSLIAQEQAKAEAERKAREKAEADRKAREKAEADRIAREKAEADRIAREKADAERLAKEKADAERLVAENAAKSQEKSENSNHKADSERKTKTEANRKADIEQTKEDKTKDTKTKKKKNSEKSARSKKDRKKKDKDIKQPVKTSDPVPSVNPKAVERQDYGVGNTNFASLRGNLPRPVEGAWRITNPFGRHSMPELPEIEYDNPGIDAEVSIGAAVKAVCSGKVSAIYKLAGFGTVVIVNHGEYYTVYGNLASANVSLGSPVAGGHTLGTVAADPDDHRHGSVHFEVWKGREKQNPSNWIR